MALSKASREFCEEYVLCYNATRTMLKLRPNITYDSASVLGSRELKKPECQEYIKELQAQLAERWGNKADVIINELMEDIVTKDANGKHNSTWQKSVDLAQKQLNLQKQDIKAQVETANTISITIGDEE